MAAAMVLMGRRSGSYGCAIQNGEKLETEFIKILMAHLPLGATMPVWRLRTDNMLCMCNNGSGGNNNNECSDLGGGCSDGDGEGEDNDNSGNGVDDSSNGGKDNSGDSGGNGKLASITNAFITRHSPPLPSLSLKCEQA